MRAGGPPGTVDPEPDQAGRDPEGRRTRCCPSSWGLAPGRPGRRGGAIAPGARARPTRSQRHGVAPSPDRARRDRRPAHPPATTGPYLIHAPRSGDAGARAPRPSPARVFVTRSPGLRADGPYDPTVPGRKEFLHRGPAAPNPGVTVSIVSRISATTLLVLSLTACVETQRAGGSAPTIPRDYGRIRLRAASHAYAPISWACSPDAASARARTFTWTRGPADRPRVVRRWRLVWRLPTPAPRVTLPRARRTPPGAAAVRPVRCPSGCPPTRRGPALLS